VGCDGRVKSKASWWKSGKRREIMGERSDCIADKADTLRGHWLRDCVSCTIMNGMTSMFMHTQGMMAIRGGIENRHSRRATLVEAKRCFNICQTVAHASVCEHS